MGTSTLEKSTKKTRGKKTPPQSPSADPVTQYALDVMSCQIVAGRAVRLAADRHLKDLTKERTAAFPYYFDRVAAQHIIDFFPNFLTLESGEPFTLPPWLQFFHGSVFGWQCWGGDGKTPLPAEHVRRAGKRRFVYAFGETSKGSGKALALDTPIPTPAGWTTMGAIHPGDVVFDERGRAVPVVGVSGVMDGHTCYEVMFDDGSSIVADEEHLWYTERRNGKQSDGRIASAGVKMSERGKLKFAVRTTAEIADTLRYSNGKYRSANHSIPVAGPLGTSQESFDVAPYVLGVWLGDGDSDCARLTVADADVELLAHVSACGEEVGERAQSIVNVRVPRYRIGAGGPEVLKLQTRLRKMGMFAQRKHIPSVYLRGSVDQRLALLQGLMDTDGYINPINGECEFCTTDKSLADGVSELIVSLGIKCAVTESAAKLYGREVSRRWRMHFHPPHDLPVFRLARKVKHQRQRHTRRRLSGDRRIVDVRAVASVPVKCIAVDTPSHLYLAGRSMVPTHNTPSLGGIGLYGITFDDEAYAEVYAAGFDKDQASIALNDGIRMAENSPDLLDEGLDVGKYNIANIKNGSWFRALSSEHRGKSGPRPHMVLGDEIHEHRDGRVINKLTAGFKGRTQPLAVLFTNSGSDKTSICWEYHQKSLAVLEGVQPDEQWFAYVCHLDPCDKCYAEGFRQPKDGCEHCDDWTDPAVWPKIAPALGVVIQPKYLQDAVTMALSVPSEYSLKRRLNFCIWTETHQVWIPPDQYEACRVAEVAARNDEGLPCAAGLDLSSKIDLSSLVLAVRYDDPPQTPTEHVVIDGIDEEGERVEQSITLDFSVDLIPFFWMPKETLLERVRTERIPYDVWSRNEHLFATTGGTIDHQAIYDFIVKDIWKRYKVQRLGYDERDATMLAVHLRDRARLGDKVVAVGQGKKLSEAFKLIEVLIRSRRLRHDGHPVLAWNFANAEPKRDRLNALWIEKPSETKRIDGAVAAAMAIKELMVLPAKRKRSGGVWFV